ncbi:integrase [Neorhizobium galegae]|uniref:tyrosine-type recombinase/integrase n=1 Tax=Neorhizobium galegae TaxID=399 RepID=UPI0027803816|nr:tyrosine-type recombinase/integrase [Neorhizobium galegae]MDQ0135028.1 integrase [Neorhizobium galegae]
MARRVSKRDPDRYLLKRGGFYSYSRRVPGEVAKLDSRAPMIRKALSTDDLAQARAQRDLLEKADDEFWAKLILAESGDHTALLKQAQAAASALGLTYRHASAILGAETGDAILTRMRAFSVAPVASLEASAAMGTIQPPAATVSKALKVYFEEIAADEVLTKSANQRRHWEAVKRRAADSFIAEVGDKPLDEITRDDARRFYDFWRRRIAPTAGRPSHSANSGNRDIGNLRVLFSSYMKHVGHNDLKNPFEGLSFRDRGKRTRPPFKVEWIKSKILTPGALANLNDEARGILLALIETGCRPSELCNLTPDRIVLDDRVPHIDIRAVADPESPREIKTKSSTRRIPLVGVALEVFKKHKIGFPRYKDKEDSLSAALNKFMRENELLPSKDHTVYSLRHAFEDRMKVAGLDTELRMIIMGHASDRPSYGEGGSLQWRRDELLKIVLPFEPAIV